MRTILLNADGWDSESDFYREFLPMVGAPSWHGNNLDALEESIRDCDINETNVPYRIIITGAAKAGPRFQEWLPKLKKLVDDLIRDGVPIELQVS